jgi:hypothetical protein
MATNAPTPIDLWPELPASMTPRQIIDAGIRSRTQLHRDIASGDLPAYKLGGRIWIQKADLMAMVRPIKAAS